MMVVRQVSVVSALPCPYVGIDWSERLSGIHQFIQCGICLSREFRNQ